MLTSPGSDQTPSLLSRLTCFLLMALISLRIEGSWVRCKCEVPVSQDVHGVCDTHPPARLVSALVAVVVTEVCKVLQEVRPVSCLAPVDGEESLLTSEI